MKIRVHVITARINGKLIFAEGIQDAYSEILVEIDKDELDEASIIALREDKYTRDYDSYFTLGTSEAKDTVGTYGNLIIAIESKEIELV